MLYLLRFKSSRMSGIVEKLHRVTDQDTPAATQARAEASARAWCNTEPGRVYIGTAPAVAFDDANLGELPAAQPIEPQDDAAQAAPRSKKGATALPA